MIETPGAGYGPPKDRDLAAIREDVDSGKFWRPYLASAYPTYRELTRSASQQHEKGDKGRYSEASSYTLRTLCKCDPVSRVRYAETVRFSAARAAAQRGH